MERLDVVQDYQIDTYDQEDTLDDKKQITEETSDTETKENEKINKRPRRKIQVKASSASKLNLKGRNMTPNPPTQEGKYIIHA